MKKNVKRKGYELTFENGTQLVTLKIRRDHHAESILRGLVHSGFAVRITEKYMEFEAIQGEDWDEVEPVAMPTVRDEQC